MSQDWSKYPLSEEEAGIPGFLDSHGKGSGAGGKLSKDCPTYRLTKPLCHGDASIILM